MKSPNLSRIVWASTFAFGLATLSVTLPVSAQNGANGTGTTDTTGTGTTNTRETTTYQENREVRENQGSSWGWLGLLGLIGLAGLIPNRSKPRAYPDPDEVTTRSESSRY
ncbi:MAG: WGxxGxxG family protein [Scytonema sp. PMC 1069.18]|nr:WGxxGxxG family protein [Scytonema sp. PMC 1069.18]MEC4881254.1 WGxxGxxG family protein [Scytonema sp. PMC 1070.18]